MGLRRQTAGPGAAFGGGRCRGDGGAPARRVAPAGPADRVVGIEVGRRDVDDDGRAYEPAGEENGGHGGVASVEPNGEEAQKAPAAPGGGWEGAQGEEAPARLARRSCRELAGGRKRKRTACVLGSAYIYARKHRFMRWMGGSRAASLGCIHVPEDRWKPGRKQFLQQLHSQPLRID